MKRDNDETTKVKRKVLILGGTKFIGRCTVSAFVEQDWDVTTYNRGRVHWAPHKDLDKIHCEIGDRHKEGEFYNFLVHSGPWDAVVDFTSFNANDMRIIVQALKDRTKHYVFISTDSIYMVCPSTESKRSEDSAVRPTDKETRTTLKQKDRYGHDKYKCEQILVEAYKANGFPYTSIRIPDVFGPFDNTKRHWRYQLWLRCGKVELSDRGRTIPLSFIFSEDVSRAVLSVIDSSSKTIGQAINFAQKETPTLQTYLETTAKILNITPQFEISPQVLFEWLPSVDFGPISIEKAEKMLNWEPTPMEKALEITCKWHEEAWWNFPKKRPLSNLDEPSHQRLLKYYEETKK